MTQGRDETGPLPFAGEGAAGIDADELRFATAAAGKVYGDVHSAKLVRVHDGDTLVVTIPSWPRVAGEEIEVRLYGVDAPELADPRPELAALALKARDRLAELVRSGGGVSLLSLRRDKYFRLLADVWAPGENLSAGAVLCREGLARPYTGQGPKPW